MKLRGDVTFGKRNWRLGVSRENLVRWESSRTPAVFKDFVTGLSHTQLRLTHTFSHSCLQHLLTRDASSLQQVWEVSVVESCRLSCCLVVSVVVLCHLHSACSLCSHCTVSTSDLLCCTCVFALVSPLFQTQDYTETEETSMFDIHKEAFFRRSAFTFHAWICFHVILLNWSFYVILSFCRYFY